MSSNERYIALSMLRDTLVEKGLWRRETEELITFLLKQEPDAKISLEEAVSYVVEQQSTSSPKRHAQITNILKNVMYGVAGNAAYETLKPIAGSVIETAAAAVKPRKTVTLEDVDYRMSVNLDDILGSPTSLEKMARTDRF